MSAASLASSPATAASSTPTARLSVMMFLQFFIWGAWYTTIAVFMRNHGMETLTSWPYTVNPVAAIAAPFFVGLVADRYFPTQKVLAVLHLAGGLVLLVAPRATGNPTLFIVLLLLYNLCYMPTLGLSSSLAFNNIADQERQFPRIRVWGTIGWIVAGLFLSFVLKAFVADGVQPEQTALPLYTAAWRASCSAPTRSPCRTRRRRRAGGRCRRAACSASTRSRSSAAGRSTCSSRPRSSSASRWRRTTTSRSSSSSRRACPTSRPRRPWGR
jgi:hypothetical protein